MQYLKSATVLASSLFVLAANANAQVTDSTTSNLFVWDTAQKNLFWRPPPNKKSFTVKPYIISDLMVAYGFTTIENDGLQRLNGQLKDEMYAEIPHKKIHLVNYLQFATAVMVFGLDTAGIKANHNLRDRTFLFLMSNIINNASLFHKYTFSSNAS